MHTNSYGVSEMGDSIDTDSHEITSKMEANRLGDKSVRLKSVQKEPPPVFSSSVGENTTTCFSSELCVCKQ